MAVDNEKLKASKPGSTQEETNSATGPGGFYRHPESGETAILLTDPLYGNAQVEGFLRLGFVYERPAKPGEVVTMEAASIEAEKAQERKLASVGDVKGLHARLDQIDTENERLRKENEDLKAKLAGDTPEGVPGGEAAKADGEAHVEAGKADGSAEGSDSGTNANGTPAASQAVTEAPQKALADMNHDELDALAASVGVDFGDTQKTKKEKVAAIEARQVELAADKEEGKE